MRASLSFAISDTTGVAPVPGPSPIPEDTKMNLAREKQWRDTRGKQRRNQADRQRGKGTSGAKENGAREPQLKEGKEERMTKLNNE